MLACKPTQPKPTETAVPSIDVVESTSAPGCDPASWTSYASSKDAFASVLATNPRVLAVGETHARRGAAGVITATERFSADLLPLAQAKGARVLVVELLSPPSGCESDTKAVAAAQKPVVEQQDDQNQDRFIALGHRAKELGLTPLVLEPSCDEFASVRKAGPDGVAAMLELIAQNTRAKLERLLAKTEPDETIVAYGGALHNNLGEDAPFAFGEQLKNSTGNRYVAVDVIVPEYVADTDAWKKLPWYPCWPEISKAGAALLKGASNEFTLFMEPGLVRPEAGNASSGSKATDRASE